MKFLVQAVLAVGLLGGCATPPTAEVRAFYADALFTEIWFVLEAHPEELARCVAYAGTERLIFDGPWAALGRLVESMDIPRSEREQLLREVFSDVRDTYTQENAAPVQVVP